MFHSRKLNNHLNRPHGRALRLVYKDDKARELLSEENYLTLNHKNLQLLTTEIFKVRNDPAPDTFKVSNCEKTHPPSVYVIGRTYFDKYFSFHVITERHSFL